MWFRRAKRSFNKHSISEVQRSADDRFDLKLQELVNAQQHFNLVLP